MAKINKKVHNWKARQQNIVTIDRGEESKIKLDLVDTEHQHYDDSNALVLPSKKRKTKSKGDQPLPVKKLSKKQRRRLEKIIEHKEKKKKRAGLLDALQNVQASKDELSQLHSTTELHSQSYKRHVEKVDDSVTSVNALSGSNKKKKIKLDHGQPDSAKGESSCESETSDSESETSESESETTLEVQSSQKDSAMDSGEDSDIKSCSEGTIAEQTGTAEPVTCPQKTALCPAIPTVHVPIIRDPAIQEERLQLPILGEEQVIMETIIENPVTILCGETGSGKTTQVPQFLYEAGYASGERMIAVTEPRRVAAISMAKRVAREMNLTGREVSYQIRYEGNVTPHTKIKFLTDGVLLKEVQKDFLLSSYNAVIIDEAHERSMYTDILIGLLSRIVPLRNKKGRPLKLIIMSATLRVEDFTENKVLFKSVPPVVKVQSRQFPVTVHFNKITPDDYLAEAFKKISKIHRELPEGGILVFVTGQQEVHTLSAKLKRKFPQKQSGLEKATEDVSSQSSHNPLPPVSLDDYAILPEEELADRLDDRQEYASDSELDESDDEEEASHRPVLGHPLYILPLYSLLSTDKQQRVFEESPPGCRLCVVATNVAETSITIPGIRYVVDTGKTKTKFYDKVTGVSAFKVTWTSKASANQRAGRAGRTGPGHCYRLYSSAIFTDELEQFSPPEIVRRPVEDLVLQMKSMCIDKVVNFPFPTPPNIESLKAAEDLLTALGAIDVVEKGKSSRVTTLGKTMAAFPVSPRYGKMLSLGEQQDLLVYVVALVSTLSVQELLVETPGDEMEQPSAQTLGTLKRSWAGVGESLLLGDMSVLLHAVGACEYAGGTEHFCTEHHIRHKAMVEVRKLRRQLTNTVNTVLPSAELAVNPKMTPPTELQCKLLRQILLAGLGDRVAMKLPPETLGPDGKKIRFAYKCTSTNDYVYIHPSSVLYKHQPKLLLYQSLEETSKLYMKGISTVEMDWLPVFAPRYCMFSKPLEDPKPTFDLEKGQVMCHMTSNFGPHSWLVPAVELPYPASPELFKWFAVFLLDGTVCPALKKYTGSLLSQPVTMVKSWAKLQPRTEQLLKTLISKNVFSRDTLREAWSNQPTYLLSAYKEWLPEILHGQIEKIWPPVETVGH